LLGERHPKPSNCFRNIAVIIGQQGQLDEALKMQIKALKIRNRTLGEDHVSVGDSLHDIAIVYGSQGDYDEALEMYEEALAVYTRALGIDNHKNARVHQSIARAKSESGDMVDAMVNSREAGCERRRREVPSQPGTAHSCWNSWAPRRKYLICKDGYGRYRNRLDDDDLEYADQDRYKGINLPVD